MSEPTPPVDPVPAAEPSPEPKARPARRRVNWHRVRIYALSILLMGAMWFCGVMFEICFEPIHMVNRALSQLPYPASAGDAHWVNRRTLMITGLRLGDFFTADTVVVTASPWGLWRHHLAEVQVTGSDLSAKALAATLARTPTSKPRVQRGLDDIGDKIIGFFTGYSSEGLDWVIGRVEISHGTVMLDNLIEDTAVPIGLGVARPIVLTSLHLGKPDASPEMTQMRTVEISSVSIRSPFDPLSPVFYFPLTRVTFSYEEIWHHHIERIHLIHPTLFLGQDLFWLTDQLKGNGRPTPTTGVSAPWRVSEFAISYGQLAVNAFGQPVARFPFYFNTSVQDIRLDQLDQISMRSSINIANLTQDYPEYKVRIDNLRGKLYFSWPPSNTHANNVVNTIQIDEISWNNVAATNVSTVVTFDPTGVYGRLNGTCEGGQLSGNFEFYYKQGFPWNADFFAQKVNCKPVAEHLVGKYVDLSGELDGRVSVQGRATEIQKCTGLLQLPRPGELNIKSMNDLLNRLPPGTIAVKRDALKLLIDSFKSYPYDNGKLTLDYSPAGGTSSLHLDGPRGARDFSVELHPFEDTAAAGKRGWQDRSVKD